MRRQYLEEDDNHERWLISYADFITLLFGFFVVMYAISSVNEGKYKVLSSTLTQAFHQEPRSIEPIQVGEPLLAASPHVVDIPDKTGYRDADDGNTHVTPNRNDVADRLAGFSKDAGVIVQENNDWLEISLDASLMFQPGSATLSSEARVLLAQTADYLGDFDNPITVEGYTDNVPISSVRFASNWDLSSARASSVARSLVGAGIDRKRLAAVGYGENHSLATNATPGGREKNRRVVIVIARQGNQPRNLNAGGGGAFAFVRQDNQDQLDASVLQLRTADGGLLFTNEPLPSDSGSPGPGNATINPDAAAINPDAAAINSDATAINPDAAALDATFNTPDS